MTMINKLQQAGVLMPQSKTNKLGVDLNQDGKIQDQELVLDKNKNGKTDAKEVLDFIVNNVTHMPTILQVESVLKDDTDVQYPEILKAAAEQYLPKLELIKKKQIPVMVKQFEKLQKEKNIAVKELDADKVAALDKEITVLGCQLSDLGVHPLVKEGVLFVDDKKIVYMKDGQYNVKQSYYENGNLKSRQCEVKYDYHKNGKLKSVTVPHDFGIDEATGKHIVQYSERGIIVEFKKNGGVSFIKDEHGSLIYDRPGNVIYGAEAKELK